MASETRCSGIKLRYPVCFSCSCVHGVPECHPPVGPSISVPTFTLMAFVRLLAVFGWDCMEHTRMQSFVRIRPVCRRKPTSSSVFTPNGIRRALCFVLFHLLLHGASCSGIAQSIVKRRKHKSMLGLWSASYSRTGSATHRGSSVSVAGHYLNSLVLGVGDHGG